MDWGLAGQIATLLAGGALASSAIALGTLRLAGPERGKLSAGNAPAAGSEAEGAVFLLRGEELLDATAAGRLILSRHPGAGSDLQRLLGALSPRFPTLGARLAELSERRRFDLAAADGSAWLEAEWSDGVARLRLVELHRGARRGPTGAMGAALLAELDELRTVARHTPVPIWRTTADGRISWANAAYLDLAERMSEAPGAACWPPPVLFEGLGPAATLAKGQRHPLTEAGTGRQFWYRCSAVELADGALYTALPEDRAVAAERSLSKFVQTMSNTFAALTVGLAIFDGRRVLSLFNPALAELTGLPVEFLAGRPTLHAFLDRLRDHRMTPEPRDYRSWRRNIAELEAAARDGAYSEIWPLVDGRTFRVDGRPHHDGAIALVFEDISSEVSLTRRFRAEIETGQAVIDSLDEAIAVFSAAGIMTLANRAYARLWGSDPLATLKGDITLLDATRTWNMACVPTPVWGDVRDFAAGLGERSAWSAEVRLRDGRRLQCRFEPIQGGAMLAGFRELDAAVEASPPRAALEGIEAGGVASRRA
ncbi:PAS domain-containing protein [Meinhardsimonia xiamenensis]|jgi:PAS domain-containing protein|uniref:PAS domain-containing protein n=1 Tax=Meinhardsimonia xiamenensis TaxID=990712 RepID=A0A1G8Y900_9RHOB|nr:PAS domain-containing protein [Meinhardsimonia xiamenensis]PRX37208.1 PAS domain-containing protein [Meinhardsimonia xiamenensis]SDJ99153.1 PAS domain-containing protein [Meinhardsimonia xiamenensis]